MIPSEADITTLLNAWSQGDPAAGDRLFAVIQKELQQIARQYLRRQRQHTLQTIDLVNEAYLRLHGGGNGAQWQDRAHFFAVAAVAIRTVLVDHARRKQRLKRGQGVTYVTLDEALDKPLQKTLEPLELIALDEALRNLEKLSARQCWVAVLRFFSGLSVEETAEVLKVSPITIKRDWNAARHYLARELAGR